MKPFIRAVPATFLRFSLCAILALPAAVFAQTLGGACEMGEPASLALKWTDDMRPIGEAVINGTPVAAMISTAAVDAVVLNRKTLDRLGIAVRYSQTAMFPENPRNPTGSYMVQDVSFAVLDDFSFGPFRKQDVVYRVEDFMDDSFGVRVGAEGLLHADLEIALDAGYLRFFKPRGCFREHLAYWDPQAVVVPTLWDLQKRDPRILFSVRIGGKSVNALLSTATPHSYIPKAAGEWLGLASGSPGAQREDPLPGHGHDKPVWKVTVPSMSIGALDIKDFDLRLMDLPHSGDVMILGADFLHRHRVYIAMSQNKIYLSPIQTPRAVKRGSVEVISPSAQ